MRRSVPAISVVLLVGAATAVLAQPRGRNRRPSPAGDAGAAVVADAAVMDAAAPADASTDAPASDVTWPMRQVGQGTLIHFPVPEQLARTGVPVFAPVRSSAPIDHVSLFYRGVGARRFTELRMLPMGQQFRMPNGYGALIPCDDIFPPRVEYYVQSIDSSGAPNGNAGTEAQPVQIPIVERRSHPAPVLPGQEPPRTCGGMTGPSRRRSTPGSGSKPKAPRSRGAQEAPLASVSTERASSFSAPNTSP